MSGLQRDSTGRGRLVPGGKSVRTKGLMYRIYITVLAISAVCSAALFSACLTRAEPHMPFTIVWNFDTSGYLETCGCSANQLGGLARRASKIAQLRENQPVLAIEGAHVVADKGGFQLFKGQMIVASLNTMGYNALQLGVREAQQGKADLAKLIEAAQFPCFSANLQLDGQPWATAYAVTEVAGNKIGITGVTQPSMVDGLEMPAEMSFGDPFKGIDAALAALEKEDCDLIIACLEGQPEWLEQFSQTYKTRVGLFLSGNRQESTADLEFHSDPPRLNIWDKGRFMGLLTVDPQPADSGTPAYIIGGSHVPLGEELGDHESIQALLDNDYKPKLKDMFFEVFKSELTLYLPPEYCADCHPREVETYNKSGHAIAMQTLVDKGQAYNPDCMKCHVTYDPAEDKLHSMNCVVCHTNITEDHVWQATKGPEHVVLPETPVTSYSYSWCYRCHDPLNSANFEAHYPQYVNKIFHGGDISEAEQKAKELGIIMTDPPPAHH
jgi:hypothetical protein